MYVYTGKRNKFAFVFTLCYAHALSIEGKSLRFFTVLGY